MAAVRWSHEAATGLERIYEYIARSDPNAALTVVTEIYERAQSLEQFPKRGYLHSVSPQGEVRAILSGPYRIAYLVVEPDTVMLLAIDHSALEIDPYLQAGCAPCTILLLGPHAMRGRKLNGRNLLAAISSVGEQPGTTGGNSA